MSHLALLKHHTQAIKNPPPTFQTVSLRTRVNLVVLPGGNRRVLGIVLAPELLYPLQVLRCRRRWRRWRRRERPHNSHLLDDALKARRGDD
jgi:hypothetical protein